jgi:hypothetical protein
VSGGVGGGSGSGSGSGSGGRAGAVVLVQASVGSGAATPPLAVVTSGMAGGPHVPAAALLRPMKPRTLRSQRHMAAVR